MPIENRLDMELTGIKTPVGLKIKARTSMAFSKLDRRFKDSRRSSEMRSVFAERVARDFT